MVKIGQVAGAVHIGDALHRLPCRQPPGDLHGLVLAHAVADDVGTGIFSDAGQHSVQPVIVMRKTAQGGFQAAQDHGQVRVSLFGQLGVNRGAAVRAGTALSAGGILILRAGDLCHRVVAHHAVHIAAADEEAVLRLAEPLEVLAVGIAGLCQHADLIALCLQQAADDGSAKAGVVHIGVTAHHHKVQLVPAACFHVCPADGQKFGVDLWGRVVHNAPFVDSIPSQSTPYGVASSPEGELLLYSVQSLFFDMQNVSYPFLKLSLRESWRVSA